MKKALVAGALLVLAFGGWLWAQPISLQNLSGQECWNVGQGAGGPGGLLCVPLVRNGTDITTYSGSGAVVTQAAQNMGTLYWTGAAPTTWAITLPANPFDGEVVRVSSDTTLTTMVTVTAGTGATMNAAYTSQTVTANTTAAWQFDQPGGKWFRLQ